jgi:hypothetical protein
MRGLVGAAEIKFLLREFAVVPFADVSNEVAVFTEQPRVSFGPRCGEKVESRVAMARHPLAREQRCPAHPADGGSDAIVSEAHALGRELVEVGCFYDWVAGRTERIMAPIVGVENQNIQWFSCGPSEYERRYE